MKLKFYFKRSFYTAIIFSFLCLANAEAQSLPRPEKAMLKLIDQNMKAAARQYKYLRSILPTGEIPRSIANGKLQTTTSGNWVSGFFPGSLFYLFSQTRDNSLCDEAEKILITLEKEQNNKSTHDLGFMMYCSFGNALKIKDNDHYKTVLINSAKSLLSRFNPTVGCIKSWDWTNKDDYPVCIDNMMNLELLCWATYITHDSSFYKAAVSHTDQTLKNHFRPDYSSYHIVVYDRLTGAIKKKRTGQGFSDESAWARGQAWALYGLTTMYRETKDGRYLDQARHIADFILNNPNLPADKIPYWDYNAPDMPNALRDASSAAIMASALIELSRYEQDKGKADRDLEAAAEMIKSLSKPRYMAKVGTNEGFLLKHSVGSMVNHEEIDEPVTYADYYFIEAMTRYVQLNKEGK
jgi:hypothetical protein